jgi:hypothetical protein
MNKSELLGKVVETMELTLTLGNAKMQIAHALNLVSESETEDRSEDIGILSKMLSDIEAMEERLGNKGQEAADSLLGSESRCATCPGPQGGCCK